MKTWKTAQAIVEEIPFDYDLHAFAVFNHAGDSIGVVFPNDVYQMRKMIESLDARECPIEDGWEDGYGNVLREFILDVFCVEFLNECERQKHRIVGESDLQRFIKSLRNCHSNGYYLSYSKASNCWKLSDKNPQKLEKQIQDFDHLIAMTFRKVKTN